MLSIIVPIYKIEEYLAQCVESILVQTYKDFELILVDDGSPDRCPEICDLYAERDNRVRVVHKKNGGLVSARKSGLQIAKGEYIGYVDGDDWIEPEFYERLMRTAVSSGSDIVASGFIKNIGNNLTLKTNPLRCGFYTKEEIISKIIPNMMFDLESYEPGLFTYVWNKIFRKSVLWNSQMNVPNEISLGEDAACVYPAVQNAVSLYITDDCLYHYRQRADSMLKVSDNYNHDYACYKLLYTYLSKFFYYNDSLIKELNKFVLYLITTRCGGVCEKNGIADLFLYNNQPIEGRIVVYGAGTLGQHLVKRLLRLGRYNIVKWVDLDYETLRNHELLVDPPDSVVDVDCDNIIIAFFNKSTAEQIKRELIKKGIPENKILVPSFLDLDYRETLNKFGIE